MTTNASPADAILLAQQMIEIVKGRASSNVDIPVRRVTSALKAGFNANVLCELRHYIPMEVLSSALDLTKRTLSEKANAHVMLSSRQSDMLLHLVRAWSTLLSFFDNDRELLLAWLDNEVSDIDGAKSRLLLGSTYGRKVLLESVSNKAGC
jgi:uncharacterized protein (DUF2384 family)